MSAAPFVRDEADVSTSTTPNGLQLSADLALATRFYSVLGQINSARRASASNPQLEEFLATQFSSQFKLAVYGTLAPGEHNHHMLAELGGTWSTGLVTHGDFHWLGWGAAMGFPAIRWRQQGPPVAVHLLESEQLPLHWSRLDAFEGPAYRRILVPLFAEDTFVTVANLYEAL